MQRLIEIATAIFLGFLIGTAVSTLLPHGGPHSDILTFQIKPQPPAAGQDI